MLGLFELRALYGSVQVFHPELIPPCLYGPGIALGHSHAGVEEDLPQTVSKRPYTDALRLPLIFKNHLNSVFLVDPVGPGLLTYGRDDAAEVSGHHEGLDEGEVTHVEQEASRVTEHPSDIVAHGHSP